MGEIVSALLLLGGTIILVTAPGALYIGNELEKIRKVLEDKEKEE